MSTKWLADLQEVQRKAGTITQFREPEMLLDSAEHKPVGVKSDDLKRLFTLWRQAGDEIKK
ncbi:MAG: hypothetical protein Q7K28_03250, partial [Candidatus Wildermuthbacteria bacterium]|nr:hypothetical protein [Candidatus Wildermuthbacteria bacterium]